MKWNEVTWYSRLGAIILFLIMVPVLSFYAGTQYQEINDIYVSVDQLPASTTVIYDAKSNASNSTSTPKLDPNFKQTILESFSNFKITNNFESNNPSHDPIKDREYLVDSDNNKIIFESGPFQMIAITNVSKLPYIVLLSGCSSCDSQASDSIIINTQNMKFLNLNREEITNIDLGAGVFYSQKFEYKEINPPCETLCDLKKIPLSVQTHSLSELN